MLKICSVGFFKFILVSTLFLLLLSSFSYAQVLRGSDELGALTLRSVSYEIPGFSKVEFVKFYTGYTALILHDYRFKVYKNASVYINGVRYYAPLYYMINTIAKYTINSIPDSPGPLLNQNILNASSIEIDVLVNDGLSVKEIDIILPNSVLQEWKEIISTNIYVDCIDGTETSPVSSNYDLIQWGCKKNDYFYSFDILDETGTEILFPAVRSGENLHKVYPVTEAPLLRNGKYMWKIWSYPSETYGGQAFQGTFAVDKYDSGALPYLSNYNKLQWGSRDNGDFFYSVDIFDKDWNMLYKAVALADSLHSYVPSVLGLEDGQYNWKVWSFPSYSYGGDGFEGTFAVPDPDKTHELPYKSTYEMIQWESRQNGDSYYCIDILDGNGNMLYRGAKCDEYLHNYSPTTLNLDSGMYSWIIWSWPSESYGGDGFQGTFTVK